MPEDSNLYSASFTSGALLFDETNAFIDYVLINGISGIKKFTDEGKFLKINSKKARDTKVREIMRRYNSLPVDFWKYYHQLHSKNEKITFLYFTCLKTYAIVRDFHWEVVLNKWRQLDINLSKKDFARFLNRASDKHHEIDEWSDNTKAKIAQVIFLMMKEAGVIVNGKMQQVFLPDDFWFFFVTNGEGWFLEAMFLSKEQRNFLSKKTEA